MTLPYTGDVYFGYFYSIQYSGVITATVEWQEDYPGEPAPQCVVVREDARMWAYSRSNFVGPVTTGFTDETKESGYSPPHGAGPDYVPGTYYRFANRLRYSIRTDRPKTITFTCDARLDVIGSDCNSIFYYGVSAQPVEITLRGGKLIQGQRRYLIGQRLYASIAPPYELAAAATGTAPAYQWTITGGSPFKSFKVSPGSLGDVYSAQRFGKMEPLATADLQSSSIASCFAKSGNVTIKCNAVHLAVPVGALPTSGIDVPASELTTSIVAPEYIDVDVHKSAVVLAPATPADPNAGSLGLYGPNGTNGARRQGINFRSEITTPPEFWSDPNDPLSDRGGWRWVQTIQYDLSRKIEGSPTITQLFRMDQTIKEVSTQLVSTLSTRTSLPL